MWKTTKAASVALAWFTELSHWCSSDKESVASCVVLFFHVTPPSHFFLQHLKVAPAPAFQSEKEEMFCRGKSLCSKIKNNSAPLTRHSVGDSIKSLPCDLFSEKQTAASVSEDQSHQRRAARVWAKSWHLSESFHHRKIVSCRSGEWLAWRYIDTLMQWMPRTVQ